MGAATRHSMDLVILHGNAVEGHARPLVGVLESRQVAVQRELADDLLPVHELQRELANGARSVKRNEELANANLQVTKARVVREGIEDGRGVVGEVATTQRQ